MKIFFDLFSRFDAVMKACSRKVLLLLDNFSGYEHPIRLPNLTSTTVQIFLPCTTSELQSIVARIILCLKRLYRTLKYNCILAERKFCVLDFYFADRLTAMKRLCSI